MNSTPSIILFKGYLLRKDIESLFEIRYLYRQRKAPYEQKSNHAQKNKVRGGLDAEQIGKEKHDRGKDRCNHERSSEKEPEYRIGNAHLGFLELSQNE
nr:hypothetical protein [Raoultibacter phocaeensis]